MADTLRLGRSARKSVQVRVLSSVPVSKIGDPLNNCKDNLQFLCPNCHSQTGTFGVRNIFREFAPNAEVVELADTLDSKSSAPEGA